MRNDILRSLGLALIPIAVLVTQRIQLVHGRRIDPGQLIWIAIGAILFAESITASGWVGLLLIAVGIGLIRALVAAEGDSDSYTLLSIVQWLLVPLLMRHALSSGSAQTAGPSLGSAAIIVIATCGISVYLTDNLRLAPTLRALPEASLMLRVYRVRLMPRMFAMELLVAANGVASGMLFASALPTVSSESFVGLMPWILAVAVLGSLKTWWASLAWLVILVIANVAGQLNRIVLFSHDATPLFTGVLATAVVVWQAAVAQQARRY